MSENVGKMLECPDKALEGLSVSCSISRMLTRRSRLTSFSYGGIGMFVRRNVTVLIDEPTVCYTGESFLAAHLHSTFLPKMEHVR
jgi:hypothetical protein